MRKLFSAAVLLSMTCAGSALADAPAKPAKPATTQPSVRLWEGAAPGAQGDKDWDIPTLTLYRTQSQNKAPTAALIVCPGGGYGGLAIGYEGYDVAEWANAHGISGFVLKYRLGSHGYRHPIELGDVQRAVRMVRANAGEWGIDPKRIAVIGFSAGGHLASSAVTHFDDGDPKAKDPIDQQSCRPDLGILVYPVITMGEFTHVGSRRNLLGSDPDPALVELMSSEKQVTPQTPPCFLVSGMDDTVVPVENSIQFVLACRKNKVPCELHVYEHGRHGFGLGKNDPILGAWPNDLAAWLHKHGFTE